MISILKRLDQNLEVVLYDRKHNIHHPYDEHSIGLYTGTEYQGKFETTVVDDAGFQQTITEPNAVCLGGK
jgi:hypothetical protein